MDQLLWAIRLRTGGGTRRCHGIRHLGEYRVDSHSWGVAVLMWQLWPEHFPRLAEHCLFHDVPEAWIGDIPAPTKRYSSDVKQAIGDMERTVFEWLRLPVDADLPPEDKARLKACDLLELYLWAREQECGGNLHATCVAREVARFVDETPLPEPAQELYMKIREAPLEALQHRTDGVMHWILKERG